MALGENIGQNIGETLGTTGKIATPASDVLLLGAIPLKSSFESIMVDGSLNTITPEMTFGDFQFPGNNNVSPTDYSWPASTAVVENDYCYSGANIFKIEGTANAGITGSSEPTWDTTTAGTSTTTDGTCTWTYMGQAASQVLRGSEQLGNGYYDALWVWNEIWRYRRDNLGEGDRYQPFARFARSAYRDEAWRQLNVGSISRFPVGLWIDYTYPPDATHWSNSDISTLADATILCEYGGFRNITEFQHYDSVDSYRGGERSMQREVAYIGISYLYEEKFGAQRRTTNIGTYGTVDNLTAIVNWLLNHFWQAINDTYTHPDTRNWYHQPFQAGLAAHTLIDIYEWEVENARDPDALLDPNFPIGGNSEGQVSWTLTDWASIPEAIEVYFYWLYNTSTVNDSAGTTPAADIGTPMMCHETDVSTAPNSCGTGTTDSFKYASSWTDLEYNAADGQGFALETSPALNNLMLAAYGWMGKYIYDHPSYVRKEPWGAIDWFLAGDGLWEGCWANVDYDYDLSGKAFNQNYRYTFDYLRWRDACCGNCS